MVSNPIDLLKVQQKLKTEEYEDIDEFVADIELMVSNAKAFYKVMRILMVMSFNRVLASIPLDQLKMIYHCIFHHPYRGRLKSIKMPMSCGISFKQVNPNYSMTSLMRMIVNRRDQEDPLGGL